MWYCQKSSLGGKAPAPGHCPSQTHSAGGVPHEGAPQLVPLCLLPPSVDVGRSPHVPYVYVSHHGEVQNLKPIQVMTACSLDIYNFPFDVQNCSLTFTSWLHHGERRGRGAGRASVQKAARPSRWPQRTGDGCGEGRHPAPTALLLPCSRSSPLLRPPVRDINLSLWRQPELVKFDRSVFMNQGEWELLYVLSCFQEFSVKSSDSYAEMKFYVRVFGRCTSGGWGTREGVCPPSPTVLGLGVPACRQEAPGAEPFLCLTSLHPTNPTHLGSAPR